MEPQVNKNLLKAEVDANYDFLQRQLGKYLPGREGQYALLRERRLVDFFEKPADAYREGLARFSDGLFSIQEVTTEPLDLGFFSYAGT